MNLTESLRQIVGENGVVDAADVATRSAAYLRPDNLKAATLVRPANTDEVSQVMRWCFANNVGVVTHGGLTGLVHGGDAKPDEISEIGEHRLWIFGHLGDGNLHVIVQVRPQDYMVSRPKIEALVYSPLAAFHGSLSAEHGIGLEKKAHLKVGRSETEIALMRTLKAALDPMGILNPGKIL